MVKIQEQKHLYTHILQCIRLSLGFQNDIEMSSISVIQVNSIFTWLSQITIMKPFIIKPCVDIPSKHFGCCHDFGFCSPDS